MLMSVLAVSVLAWLGETFYNPHYSAPATCVILALVLLALRQLRHWNPSGISWRVRFRWYVFFHSRRARRPARCIFP